MNAGKYQKRNLINDTEVGCLMAMSITFLAATQLSHSKWYHMHKVLVC